MPTTRTTRFFQVNKTAAATTTVYTVPVGKLALIKTIYARTAGGGVSNSLQFFIGDGATDMGIGAVTTAGGVLQSLSVWVVAHAGDQIKVATSSVGPTVIAMYGALLTAP